MLIMLTSAAAGSSATTQWLPSSHQSDFVAMADAYAQAVSSLREQAERATDSLMKNGFSIKKGVGGSSVHVKSGSFVHVRRWSSVHVIVV